VPVVTLAGEVSGARVGVSLLNAAGLGELVATSEEDFVRIASDLARNQDMLASVRRGLRERVVASALCDRHGYGERLGAVLRGIWREACAPG
jgi:predicted O-linked N-acetylglucosamine transferase (SPINDLY family)